MSDKLDELQLQRLVDGALDENQRSDFLAIIDRSPPWWREVALAFVEERILCDVFQTEETSTVDRGAAAQPTHSPKKTRTERTRSFWFPQLAVVAASLAIALRCSRPSRSIASRTGYLRAARATAMRRYAA